MVKDPLLVIGHLARVFDDLGIRYAVGGSIASSMYGIPRATQGVDLIAEIDLRHAESITKALEGEFYVDVNMVREAVKHCSAFNVIHLATMFKADVFILKEDAWSREEMARVRSERVKTAEGEAVIRFASPDYSRRASVVGFGRVA